ncbi:putative transcription factor interactor and regulator FHA-SMAD family [Helianthus annuus]|nr:putative transcription factor interactor and regulator FHA-SMAD family [Helianthus annuus]KAJ0712775.1 putative transcription factor interactor and regulator FHA-SMAD family [Helianthus annuus]KAJ0889959.1 putative transcription factor interactor and regulator FHA-SMAD family [Helianthus annuus]KAJ0894733.1 putative transcription factor interactor and regulator FHA-SMAD family [Helianthus annuus]
MADNNGGQQIMNKIPQFTVIKNGSILKNIFLLSKQSTVGKSSQNPESDEEILLVGRHPECHITLEHPSISRYHLRIHSNPSAHMISVVDLSSVHGTWVSGKRIEPGVNVVLKEGDKVKIGASSRVYELHWVPCSRAYDVGESFVPAVYTIKEGREEEEMNQVVEEKHEEYSSNDDLEGSEVLSSNTVHDSPSKTLNSSTSSNENDDIFATVSIQAPLVSETTSATQVSDSLNDSEDQLMTNFSKFSCDDPEVEHEEYSLVDDLECLGLSTSNTIHVSPVKTSNPLTSGNEINDIFATVSIQSPLVVSETTSATQVSGGLNESEDQLMRNCPKTSCDDAEVEQSSRMKHEEHPLVDDLECSNLSTSNTINNSPLKTLHPLASCNENNDIFGCVSIQAPLVVLETTSATQVSDSLNDSENQLILNCSTPPFDDAEIKQVSAWKHEEYSLVDDLECLESSTSNTISNSPLKMLNPLTSCNETNDIFATVSIQAPLVVSETTSTTQFSDILNDSVDQWMPNSSTRSCDDTEVEQSSPWKTGSGNGELFTTVCVSEDISVTEMSDYLNKSEDKLNCLSDNLSNDIGQTSHATIKDDPVSIDLFNAIETHEKDASNQNIARSNETDIDNENQQQINNGSDDKTHTPDISKAQEIHVNPMSAQKLSASMKLLDSLHGKEMEFYTPDKENKNPNACSGKSLSKKPVNPIVYEEKDILGFSQNLFAMDEGLSREQVADAFVDSEEVLAITSEKESKSVQMIMEGRCNSMNYPRTVENVVNSSQSLAKKRWTMVVDTNSLLDHKSFKYLKLLEDIKGTRLFLTRTVVRELMDIESQDNFFNRSSKKASLALEWIDECMMNTSQWIHMDDDETVRRSSTVLEIALRLREEDSDQKIIILSDNRTLKIKAMAEGIMCEAAEEFHKSLVNPFSERFMWVGSSARGLTWSCVDDDDIVRQKYQGFGLNGSHKLKGLKLLARVTTS